MRSVGLIRVRVAAIHDVACGINSLELVPSDNARLPPVEAGAHIDLYLPNGLVRQYSLLNPSSDPKAFHVAVKREPSSRGGSLFLHNSVALGDTLEMGTPRNTFPLYESATSSILVAGGIGITPIWAMVQRLREIGSDWRLYYAGRSRPTMAFLDLLQHDSRVELSVDEEAGGDFLDLRRIVSAAPATAHIYCCGPRPMLEAFEAATTDWPRHQVHVEYFTAKEESARQGGFTVVLARSGLEFFIPPGKSILQVVRDAGVMASYSCEEGVCGSCETVVISGMPDHRDSLLTPAERAANKTVMICCAGSKSERLVLDL